jgi:hypothetical protein
MGGGDGKQKTGGDKVGQRTRVEVQDIKGHVWRRKRGDG